MEVPDFFFDGLGVEGNTPGAIFTFTKHMPRSNKEELSAIGRTSWEQLKVMTYVLARFVKESEKKNEVVYQVPKSALIGLKVPQEDWDAFWKADSNPKF